MTTKSKQEETSRITFVSTSKLNNSDNRFSKNHLSHKTSHTYPHRPVGFFSSLKGELSAIIVVATAIAFVMAWFLLKMGLNGWIAMPLTLAVALGITYTFSRGLTAPLRQMRDASEAMADGDYSVRVAIENRRDEVGKLTLAFNEMAEELEHDDQMRRELIANVSHELRTPVSALQAMLENLADGVIEATPANFDSILNQTHRLADLITFLLDLSRVEAGAESLNITTFDVAEFLDTIIEPLEVADAGHNHSIEVEIEQNIKLTGDRNRLSQLFTNIISNALKHSPDNTHVLICSKEDKEHNTLVSNVINFGKQIPKEQRSEIFRRFVKGNQRIGTESGGTGLGLSIARWAAELHNGTVKVVDDKRGPNFEITLPLNYNVSGKK
ncbi:sensor histidine kinase [Gardnerella sp. 2492-Sm]|uniref:sensor histidine kinase n=1 Tax=unclassified Gardnerella TaxID=2628112 RepID=UPI003D0928C5